MEQKEKIFIEQLYASGGYFPLGYVILDIGRGIGFSDKEIESIISPYHEGVWSGGECYNLTPENLYNKKISKQLWKGHIEEAEDDLKFLIKHICLREGIKFSPDLIEMSYKHFREWYKHHRKGKESGYNGLFGSVILSCRKLGIPANASSRKKSQSYLTLFNTVDGYSPATEEPYRYVRFVCEELGRSEKTIKKAIVIGEKVKNKISGINPNGFSAALVYIASILSDESYERITQGEIAAVSNLQECTIRNWYRKILKEDPELEKEIMQR